MVETAVWRRQQCGGDSSVSPGGFMVKWFVRTSASIAERMSGISSNPAEDLAFAGREKKQESTITLHSVQFRSSCPWVVTRSRLSKATYSPLEKNVPLSGASEPAFKKT